MASSLCLFWTLWKKRNRVAFENKTPSIHRLKSIFVCTLWSWAKLNSIDNLDSLVVQPGPARPIASSTSSVLLGSLVLFFIYILLFTNPKKMQKTKLYRLNYMHLTWFICLNTELLGCACLDVSMGLSVIIIEA